MIKCPKCQIEIPNDSDFCQYCGSALIGDIAVEEDSYASIKGKTHKHNKILVILLAVLNVVFAGLLIVQNMENEKLLKEIDVLTTNTTKLQNDKNELMRNVNYYNKITSAARYDSIGYAKYNFHCDTGLVIMNSTEITKKVTLTAYWSEGGTVETSNSDYNVAEVDFDKDSWTRSTQLTITRHSKGVAIIEFSNDVDDSRFSLIVIAT